MRISDWSSDVCSSDLAGTARHAVDHVAAAGCPAVEQVGRCPGTPAEAAPVDAAAIAEVRTVAVDVDVVGRNVLLSVYLIANAPANTDPLVPPVWPICSP